MEVILPSVEKPRDTSKSNARLQHSNSDPEYSRIQKRLKELVIPLLKDLLEHGEVNGVLLLANKKPNEDLNKVTMYVILGFCV